ncbi:MAG: hypothetical protein AAGA03_19365 [Planctomycetota bacterium]
MSPKQRLTTIAWCAVTMMVTTIVSHGHLVIREIMARWPQETTWEGRLENAVYTQGGLILVASMLISVATLVRSVWTKQKDEELARRELAQRERHERAAADRHEAMMNSLMQLTLGSSTEDSAPKKFSASGAKPR